MKKLITLLIIIGCNSASTPEDSLRRFVYERFKVNSDQELLKNLTVNNMNNSLLKEEDYLKEKNLFKGIKLKKFKILLKNCESSVSCFITYIVKYQNENRAKSMIEVKKIANILKIDSTWKISNVSELKTFIKMNDEISP